MSTVAAIDCGTNSIRLLIADVDRSNGTTKLTDLVREMRVVRLGQGVDATGELAPEALERTFAATAEYAELIRQYRAVKVRFVATSASRDARNRQVFVDGIRGLLGVEPEVISGDEEAALSFAGASSVLPILDGQEVLVVDLGGGSTEFVLGTAAGVTAARSVDIGCVRLTERHLRQDPPTPEQIAAAEADVVVAAGDGAVLDDDDAADGHLGRERQLVGVLHVHHAFDHRVAAEVGVGPGRNERPPVRCVEA